MSEQSNPELKLIKSLENIERYFPLMILSFALPLFFFKLGGVGFLGPDEPRYAQVAREMYERTDFVTPTLLQDTWFEKPALSYWLMMLFYYVFSPSELAARLPNALFATASLLIIYYTAKEAKSAIYGLVSALILGTSALFFGLARAASFDMPLTFSFTAAISAFYLADISQNKQSKNTYLILFYIAVGISVLAKGLVGFLLIGAIIGSYIIVTGQLRSIFTFRPFLGLLIFVLVISLWYLPVILKHGSAFIDEFFIQHHFQRFTSNKYRHPGPIYFFVLIILAGIFPWSVFAIKGIKSLLKLRPNSFKWFIFKEKQHRLILLAFLWMLIPLAFFSLSNSKLPGYILPVFPGVALLLGYELEKALFEPKTLRSPLFIVGILVFIVGCVSPYFANKELKLDFNAYFVLTPAIIFIAILLLSSSWKKDLSIPIIGIFMFSPVLAIVIATSLFPALENHDSLAPLSHTATKNLEPNEKIIFFNYLQYSPLFYSNGRVVKGEDGEALVTFSGDELAKSLEQTNSLLCITKERYLKQLTDDKRFEILLLSKQRDVHLLRIRLKIS
jgi:4-amino-4-deoxy-L-arabinose transferase-like glycosyltransferase